MKKQKRDSLEIRVWLLKNGIKRLDIENDTQMSGTVITLTIDGQRNCRPVLRYLLDKGCPEKFLALPDDMDTHKEAA